MNRAESSPPRPEILTGRSHPPLSPQHRCPAEFDVIFEPHRSGTRFVDALAAALKTPIMPAPSQKVWTDRSLDVELLFDGLDLVAEPLVFLELVGDLLDRV